MSNIFILLLSNSGLCIWMFIRSYTVRITSYIFIVVIW
nr:MAG TPA: hypothetical protein [Caudoviricetes sp.]